MPMIAFALIVLTALVLVGFVFTRLPASAIRRLMFWGGAGFLGALALFLSLRGMMLPALGVIAAGGFILRRLMSAGPSPNLAGPTTSLSQAEACEVLGVAEHATREEVEAAYKRLIQRVHPDRGGSDWLAARLTAARDVLLSRIQD